MPSANKIALTRDPAPADPAGASAAASADPAGSSAAAAAADPAGSSAAAAAAAAADSSEDDEILVAWPANQAWKASPAAPPAHVAAAAKAAQAALAAAKAASHPAAGAAPSAKVARRESRLTNRHRFLLQGSDYIQCAYKIAAAGLTHVGGVMRVAFKL